MRISLKVRLHLGSKALDKREGVDVKGCLKGSFPVRDNSIVVRTVEREIPEELPLAGGVQHLSLVPHGQDCEFNVSDTYLIPHGTERCPRFVCCERPGLSAFRSLQVEPVFLCSFNLLEVEGRSVEESFSEYIPIWILAFVPWP